MNSFSHTIEALLRFIVDLGRVIVAGIVAVELWLRAQLTHLNVSAASQNVLLLVVAALLILGALRLFGGLIRIVIVLVLLLIAVQVLMPLVRH